MRERGGIETDRQTDEEALGKSSISYVVERRRRYNYIRADNWPRRRKTLYSKLLLKVTELFGELRHSDPRDTN